MQVEAKCIMDAYDSPSCTLFKMGSTYQIERDGELARLKTSGGKMGKYVFDFDRNAGPDDAPHDYHCKKPGCEHLASFKTLAALGTHTKTEHKAGEREESDEVVVAKDGRGKKKGKTFTCKHPDCGAVLPNLYAMGQHNKTHKTAVEQAA